MDCGQWEDRCIGLSMNCLGWQRTSGCCACEIVSGRGPDAWAQIILNRAITARELLLEFLQRDLDFRVGQLIPPVLDHLMDSSPCAPELCDLSLSSLTLLQLSVILVGHDCDILAEYTSVLKRLAVCLADGCRGRQSCSCCVLWWTNSRWRCLVFFYKEAEAAALESSRSRLIRALRCVLI
jgi:hypothetical protein